MSTLWATSSAFLLYFVQGAGQINSTQKSCDLPLSKLKAEKGDRRERDIYESQWKRDIYVYGNGKRISKKKKGQQTTSHCS